ncbi:dienelactone hydrolase family protein [Maricaulaceae bacterium MS644]
MQTAFWIAGGLGAVLIAFAGFIAWTLWRRLTGRHLARLQNKRRRALIEPYVTMLYPPGEGPHPLVILLHGCGGVRRVSHAYAEAAVKAGCAAMIVDSLTPRGIDYEMALAQVCTGRVLWGRERAGDLYAALDIARDDPRIDPQRLVLAGWSHGAWAILDALALDHAGQAPDGMTRAPDAPFKGVTGVFLIYPYASGPALVRRKPIEPPGPIEAILVENDTMASEADAAAVFEQAKKDGASVRWSIYGGVTHAFDEPDHHPQSSLRYDSEATAMAKTQFVAFLKRRLNPKPA